MSSKEVIRDIGSTGRCFGEGRESELTEHERRLNAERKLAIAEIRWQEERAHLKHNIKFWESMCEMKTQVVKSLNGKLHEAESTITEMQKQVTAVATGALFLEQREAERC